MEAEMTMIVEERPATAEELAMIPRCAVCCRPVQLFERQYDPMRFATVFTARCHGAVETTEITDRDLVDFVDLRITGGEAFASKQLVSGEMRR